MGLFKRWRERREAKEALADIEGSETLGQLSERNGSSTILDRCEQVLENAREIDDGTKEYHIVTSYLNDIELIENLAPDRAEEVRKAAEFVDRLNNDRDKFLNTSKKLSDSQLRMIQLHEDEIPDVVKNLRENETYQATVKRDMQYLEGEKQEWTILKKDRRRQRKRLQRASYLLLSAVITAAVLLLILSMGFEMDMQYAWIATITVAVLGAFYIVFQLEAGKRDIRQADVNINYAITLLNKVKIKYVNVTNAVDHTCGKYHVRDARELAYQWDLYQEALREQERYMKTNEDLNYYYSKLVQLLRKCSLYDPRVWVEQPQALVEPREMVEIKHNLLVRRQKLRSKIAYNLEIVKKERKEIDAWLKTSQENDPQLQDLIASIDKLAGLSA